MGDRVCRYRQLNNILTTRKGLRKTGFCKRQLNLIKKAIKVDTSFVSAYYNLALAYHQAQQPDQAIVNLKK